MIHLVKKIVIKKSHSYYEECDRLCFLSKNIYNVGMYNIRQHYFKTKEYKNYYSLYREMKYNIDYISLPRKVSNRILMSLDDNFKSFFSILKMKQSGSYDKRFNLPNYLNSIKGRFITVYDKDAINRRGYKKTNCIKLSKTNIVINLGDINLNDISQIRIVPKYGVYIIELVYVKSEYKLKKDNNRYASVDLGVNNLATVGSNVIKPIIINGKPIKSTNQYYNKRKSKLQSKLLKNTHYSKRIERLNIKRIFKIEDYLYKASRFLVNHLVSNNINTLVIGYNKGWKQDIKIGKVNNQKFAYIPFDKFIYMLEYKCKLKGINTLIKNESYTSKCSFLDNEEIKKHDNYKGKRIKRGLFKASNNTLINADLNGALNILKKAVPDAFSNLSAYEIEGLTVSPLHFSL